MSPYDLNRFENLIHKDSWSGCWVWQGSVSGGKYKYGSLKINGQTKYAHRISYQHFNGLIPNKYDVCHTCDNTLCVNPEHLLVGTRSYNMKDMVTKGRYGKPTYNLIGEENSQHKLKNFQIKEIREKYNLGNYTQQGLAEEYAVSSSTISLIVKDKSWKHLL